MIRSMIRDPIRDAVRDPIPDQVRDHIVIRSGPIRSDPVRSRFCLRRKLKVILGHFRNRSRSF